MYAVLGLHSQPESGGFCGKLLVDTKYVLISQSTFAKFTALYCLLVYTYSYHDNIKIFDVTGYRIYRFVERRYTT